MTLTTIQRHIILISGLLATQIATAGVTMDRTRIIFDGDQRSVTLDIGNNNPELPYLAQGWIENEEGKKINGPLVVLPPVQRLEANKSSQIKIEALPSISSLPQDRESLFYFNLREIPPKSNKPNVLQVALQTRVKLFYRPKAVIPLEKAEPAIYKLTLDKASAQAVVKNPTPYYTTIINVYSSSLKNDTNFEPVMVPPFGQSNLGVSSAKLGSDPTLITINDYGGRPEIKFSCQGAVCQANPKK
ncbi:fimbria/pilus periplasmic chaperone [Providencia sp. Me31A]|uniref:fimbria/pilus periplasmic chaperone n=1 Tax=Providencia sp. Me31A TaxID=3392637 RepID=UPI003D27EE8A